MPSPINNRVRGVRQTLPPNTLVGRTNGKGPAQQIPMNQLAQALVQGGSIPLPQPGLSAIPSGDVLANTTGGSAVPVATAVTALLDFVMGSTEGQILQRGASVWQVLAPGTANQVLASGGAAALNAWAGLSALLDSAFGSTEGQILQRGASAWQVLAPGTAGQVLTSGGAAALNSWTTPTAGGTTISNQGVWSGSNAYNPGNVVQFNGVSYLCFSTVTATGGVSGTWNPADKGSTITLTSGNLVATAGSNAANGVRSTISQTTGKFYFEAVGANASNNFTGIGWANASAVVSGLSSTANYAQGFNIGSIFVNGSSLGSWPGSPIAHGGFAIDLGAQLAWWCADVTAATQVWNGSTSNSPGGSGGISTAGLGVVGTGVFIAAIIQSTAESFTLITSPGSYAHAAPTGFGPWATGSVANTSPDLDPTHWLSQEYTGSYILMHALLGGL